MKKKIYFLTVIVLIISLFAGCSPKTSSNILYNPDVVVKDAGGLKMPLTEDPVEIRWSVTSAVNTLNDSFVLKKMREMTGVNVQLDIYPSSTAIEKIKVLIAANQMPDIIGQGLDDSLAMDLASQGALAAVSDYLDELPNFKRVFADNKDNDWIFKSYAAADGKLYGFYGWDYQKDVNHGMLYRKDIFDKHGIKMWNSPEEFYQALKKLKSLYPDSVPFVSKNKEQIFDKLGTSWGIAAHKPYYDENEKVWKYSDTDLKYKDMLDFLKKLYDEKLLDPEFITMTQSAWTQKMAQADKAFVTFDWIGRLEQFKEQTLATVPSYDLRFANPIGPDQTYPEMNQLCWARYVANNDKAEVAMKLLDFCLSPTGIELYCMGVEGETYTIGEDGYADYVGFEGKVPSLNEREEKWGMSIEGMYLSNNRRSASFQFSEREQEAQDYAKQEGRMAPLDPVLQFTVEEKDVINAKTPDLQKAGKEFSVKYILGTASWDEWVKKAKSLGADEIVKIYNDAQTRQDKM